jgi:hypothetical protein
VRTPLRGNMRKIKKCNARAVYGGIFEEKKRGSVKSP